MKKLIQSALTVTLCAASLGCGDAVFSSGAAGRKGDDSRVNKTKKPITNVTSEEDFKANSLTWYWKCELLNNPAPASSSKDIVLEGAGPHRVTPTKAEDVPMTISGEICPISAPRDLVFVVDVSGSMEGALGTGNDPVVGGTCGRLEALKQVIAANSSRSDVRFAVTTFSSATVDNSNGFFTNLNAMFPGRNLVDVICGHSGGTNYSAGLTTATTLLSSSSADASKEIYFISDGAPDTATSGISEATTLKSANVNIATIMLGTSTAGDAFLKDNISSKSSTGVAYHAQVDKAKDLEQALSGLATNDLASGQMSYRAIGTSEWTTVDLVQYRSSNTFSIPGITINLSSAPEGLELQFEYQDRLGKKFGGDGEIVWDTEAN